LQTKEVEEKFESRDCSKYLYLLQNYCHYELQIFTNIRIRISTLRGVRLRASRANVSYSL